MMLSKWTIISIIVVSISIGLNFMGMIIFQSLASAVLLMLCIVVLFFNLLVGSNRS